MKSHRWNTYSLTTSSEISAKQEDVWRLLTSNNPKLVSFFDEKNTLESFTSNSPMQVGSVTSYKLKKLPYPISFKVTHLKENSEISGISYCKSLVIPRFQVDLKICSINENKTSITFTTNIKSIFAFTFRKKDEELKSVNIKSLKKLETWLNDPSIESSVQPVPSISKENNLKLYFKRFLFLLYVFIMSYMFFDILFYFLGE